MVGTDAATRSPDPRAQLDPGRGCAVLRHRPIPCPRPPAWQCIPLLARRPDRNCRKARSTRSRPPGTPIDQRTAWMEKEKIGRAQVGPPDTKAHVLLLHLPEQIYKKQHNE